MRVLVWLVEDTWESAIVQTIASVPESAEITLLFVVEAEQPRSTISDEIARGLLREARTRLGRAAAHELRHGRVEREVVAAAADADLLVMARDRSRLGPGSIGQHAQYVLDHSPCRVLLVWPDRPPSASTLPPAPY